jgi:hypothetical protein
MKTFYHLILDRSGSMADCLDNTISGFNEQADKIRQLALEYPEQQITMGLTMFNHEVRPVAFQADPDRMRRLDRTNYRPDGYTALLDAIGVTVQRLEADWQKSRAEVPTTVVVVILTDGLENASRLFRQAYIRETITRLEATKEWTFSFLGATLESVRAAEDFAIHEDNRVLFQIPSMKGQVWDKLNSSMSSYFEKKRSGRPIDKMFDE